MQVALLAVLFSLCLVSTVGRGVFMELDVESIPAIPLLEAEPIKRVGDIWENCTKASDKAAFISVAITPAVPQKGENLSVAMSIIFKEDVDGGSIDLKVKYGVIPIFSKSFVLCDIAKDSGVPCVITKGTHLLKLIEKFPSAIPSGKFDGSIIATDSNGDELLCLTFNLSF